MVQSDGSRLNIGGSGGPAETVRSMPSAVRTTADDGDGPEIGGGVVNARITYCPGGTARNVNAPVASVAVIATLNDADKLVLNSAATSSSR